VTETILILSIKGLQVPNQKSQKAWLPLQNGHENFKVLTNGSTQILTGSRVAGQNEPN